MPVFYFHDPYKLPQLPRLTCVKFVTMKQSGLKVAGGLLVAAGGLLLHVMLLLSIFDIYFRSPIVKSVEPQESRHSAVANRLVLFSVDGMRAETLLEHSYAPYLRSIASTRGVWGISNTRVPTESRPGHVAMIAGFYEDPSAVTRGWKKNPVNFDTVFNQSRYTWAWGAEDIVEIFTADDTKNKIFAQYYNTEDQNFNSDKKTILLDNWVFKKVTELLQIDEIDSDVREKLMEKNIVLFLHLLGMDTVGHSHKPNSMPFITNLKFVDNGIREMEELIETFYGNDQKTTYIMTSDHGMTDWGSHGSGDKHETETSYVMWGAGVPQAVNSDQGFVFGLPRCRRRDIMQADLAPLMATVLAVPVPVNSVGRVPIEVLNMSKADKARAVYTNSLQLAAQYNTLREQVERNAIAFLYYPYRLLTEDKYKEFVETSEKLLSQEEYDESIELSQEIMDLSLSGLSYYHNYYQNVLLACASLSFFGWIALLLTILMHQNRNTSKTHGFEIDRISNHWKLNAFCLVLASAIIALLAVQHLPAQYYLYTLVPIALWWRVLASARLWVNTLADVAGGDACGVLVQTACCVAGTMALVWSFEDRWWLSVPLLGMSFWPVVMTERKKLPLLLLFCWALTCLLLGFFSFLPVIGKNTHIHLVLLAGVICLIVLVVYVLKTLKLMLKSEYVAERRVIAVQGVVLLVALHNIYVQSKRFSEGTPVVVGYQVAAWIIAGLSITLPLLSNNRIVCRLFSINCGLLTCYLLLSVSHEGLFLITLMLNQMCWIAIELKLSNSNLKKITEFKFVQSDTHVEIEKGFLNVERSLTRHDFRRAFFFLLYIILSFFGTGNIASVNSFEVRWVTCFLTTFRPFVITGLILGKTMIPFMVVVCSFKAVNILTKAPTGYLILIVLVLCDLMGVQCLFLVRNTGSWLQIGSSISQYVISQLVTLFIILLYSVANLLCEKNIGGVGKSGKKLV